MKTQLHIITIFALTASCASIPEKIDTSSLDVKTAAKSSEKSAPAVDWKKFFRADPDVQERAAIISKLDKWSDSGNSDDLLKRAQAAMVVGRYEEAEANLEGVVRREPNNIPAVLELSKLALRTKDHTKSFEYLAEAKKLIDATQELQSEHIFRYRYLLSLTHIAANERENAHKILRDLIALDKTFTPGYVALATSYLNNDQLGLAQFIIERGMDSGKDDASLQNIAGVIAYRAGKISESRQLFDQALKLNANYVPALVNFANLAIRNFEYDSAEASLQKAITLSPDSATAYVSLGILQRKSGRNEAALASLKKALELEPTNGTARFNLGVVNLEHFKNENEAMRLFYEVLQVENASDDLKNLAQFYVDGIRESRAH